MNYNNIYKALKRPRLIFAFILKLMSPLIKNDKVYISLRWYFIHGYFIDWNNLKRFTEKLQWLKLYDRNPLYTIMVDKIEAKKYVAAIIGEEHIIPTIAIWDKAEDINFDSLPNSFVLKCNHDSGKGICICKDKNKLDYSKVVNGLAQGLKHDYYYDKREWPYKDVPRKVFAEKFFEQEGCADLIDYKWFCFGGKPMFCQVIRDRSSKETIDFYDSNWNHQSFIGFNEKAVHSNKEICKPSSLSTMIAIASKLSKGLPFARIDLYDIDNHIYFGEITFFPASGFGKFRPDIIDFEFGKLLVLPKMEQNGKRI